MYTFFPVQQHTEAIKQLTTQTPLSPFSNVVLTFIQQLSLVCVKQRHLPEVVALGYWLRKTNMNQLKQQWLHEQGQKVIKARGTVFHIAPSNVDTIFVYSWVLSLLAGNKNIVRLSSRNKLEQNSLLQLIVTLLQEDSFIDLAKRNVFLTYDHNSNMTYELSQICHVRVVWGGDATIQNVRQVALPPLATELTFADRYSLSLLKASRFLALSKIEQHELLRKFYNDAFWFDQLACSSPKLVVWEGEQEDIEASKTIFWSLLEQVYVEKGSLMASAVQVQKLATTMWMAAEDYTTSYQHGPSHSRVQLNQLHSEVRERYCGGGFFTEININHLSQLATIIEDKDQTLSYYGYDYDELCTLSDNIVTRGIDRIVPIGMALDFQDVWDGQQFIRSFTREVVIK